MSIVTRGSFRVISPVMQKLADAGARGVMNGRGFFNYTPEEARRREELYRRHAWRMAQASRRK